MQYLLNEEEFNALQADFKEREPNHATVFSADFVEMMKGADVNVVAYPEMMGEEVLTIKVKIEDVPVGIKHLVERHIGKKL